MKKFIFLWIFTGIMVSCNGPSKSTDDPVVYTETNDPELEKAKKDALSNLDYFIESFNTHAESSEYEYSLKIDFIDKEEHEHMWISVDKIENGEFSGFLVNEPQIVNNLKYGDSVKISKYKIEDWMIMNTATENWEGGYSVKVLQSRHK